MPDRIGIVAPIVYLLALGVGSVLLADAAWKSVTSYRTPYALDQEFADGEVLTERLVLVILDGLRVDRSAELRNLQRMALRGSSGSVRVGLPSLSNPARATMATGAWPEVSGVTNNSRFSAPPIQSIFSLARRRGLSIAVFGSSFWRRAFGEYLGDGYRHFEKELPGGHSAAELTAWQQNICDNAVRFLADRPATLTVVGLTAGDEAGHEFGGLSDGYRVVTQAVDDCFGRIVEAFDESSTTFVVVSDHGHIDRRGQGGHGGAEPEVVQAPIILAGKGIRVGAVIDGLLVDVAPSISALLGLPIPSNSQGRVLEWTLDATPDVLTRIVERASIQQTALATHLPDREAGLAAERRSRIVPSLFAGLWFLMVFTWVLVQMNRQHLLVAVISYFGVYYGLFVALGLGYSLSAIVREEYLNGFFLKNILAAMTGYAVGVAYLVKMGSNAKRDSLLLSLALTSLLGLLTTSIYFQYGLLMHGFMLDLGAGFKAYLELLSIFGIALATPLAYFVCRRFGRSRAA